jgi:hypothetical protein
MFHPSRPDVLLLWGAEWIASYDPHALSETNQQLIKQKFRRRSSGTTTCGNVSVCCKYSPLVFVGKRFCGVHDATARLFICPFAFV